ncbi:KTSC domain-containing protein [Pseudorhodoplanes sp.]|uniref:KTSC domain-containing protein n=1 Tax=Pseudorhodoplanes sp. TaxID=1934341 RepID=UPI00391DB331
MPVNLRPIPSSLLRGPQSETAGIRDAAYNPDRRELQITFRSGRAFAYSNVPPQLYAAFRKSPSPAAFFSIAIRGRYRFRELTGLPQQTRH